MGRPKRADNGGLRYRVLNRANARMTIFEVDEEYEAFEQVLKEAVGRTRTRLVACCVMPDHWHLIVWPRQDGELARFVGWPDADPHPAVARTPAQGPVGPTHQRLGHTGGMRHQGRLGGSRLGHASAIGTEGSHWLGFHLTPGPPFGSRECAWPKSRPARSAK